MSAPTSLLIAIERARRAAVRSAKPNVIDAIARDPDVCAEYEKLRRAMASDILREMMSTELRRALNAMASGGEWNPPENVDDRAAAQGTEHANRMLVDAVAQLV